MSDDETREIRAGMFREFLQKYPDQAIIEFWRWFGMKCHTASVDKGFYDPEIVERKTFGDITALLHSEVTEAYEGYRQGNPQSEHIPQFKAIEEEFADIAIRLADNSILWAGLLGEAIVAKLYFNRTRPHQHGGKKT